MAPVTIDNAGTPLLVFESTAEQYHQNNQIVGYWGPVASSIDWCERNYIVSFYVAEMFNTVSNLSLAGLGLFGVAAAWRGGLEHRFVMTHAGTTLVGFGSAAFHGTLSHVGQQGDETPMLIASACWLWSLVFNDPAFEARHPALLRYSPWIVALLVGAYACLHWVYRFTVSFQVVVFLMVGAGIVRIRRDWASCTDAAALRIGRTYYVATGCSAFGFWLLDQQFCTQLHSLPAGLRNPQFHAWWHILMGVNCYVAPTFLAYQRLVYLGRTPVLKYALGLVPYVVDARYDKAK